MKVVFLFYGAVLRKLCFCIFIFLKQPFVVFKKPLQMRKDLYTFFE